MTVQHSIMLAACAAMMSAAAPAMPFDALRAGNACRLLVTDPSSAINLQRPPALRYRTAPVRICVPDDTNLTSPVAFA
jgi:hypothetical protein